MKDKLISASALVEALNTTEWLVTGLGQKVTERQVRDLIDTAEAVEAIPVEYIEARIERAYRNLERIMRRSGDEYLHGEYAESLRERRVALQMLLAEWRHDTEEK